VENSGVPSPWACLKEQSEDRACAGNTFQQPRQQPFTLSIKAYCACLLCVKSHQLPLHSYESDRIKEYSFSAKTNCIFHNSIQFSLFCIAQYHKLQICLKGLYNLYTYDIPVPGPHIGSGKTYKNYTGKKGKKPSGEQQKRIPLQDGQMQYMPCVQKESLQSYNTFNEYDNEISLN